MSLFDRDADDVRMIRLQVVKARGKLHHSAVPKPLRKAFSEGSAISKRLDFPRRAASVRRLRQRAISGRTVPKPYCATPPVLKPTLESGFRDGCSVGRCIRMNRYFLVGA
jgi:hypothetical protein